MRRGISGPRHEGRADPPRLRERKAPFSVQVAEDQQADHGLRGCRVGTRSSASDTRAARRQRRPIVPFLTSLSAF